jgi:hypothetical protein
MRVRCVDCMVDLEEWFFSRDSNANRSTRITARKRCKACEQERRDRKKKDNRFIYKATSVIYRHAKKYVKSGLVASVKEFQSKYDWQSDRIAHDIEHAFANGCPYCSIPFSERQGGLAELTLDILDPGQQPYYRTNTKYCCATCNKEKQRTPPQLWAAHLVEWDRRAAELNRRRRNPNTLWQSLGWKVN